MIKKNDNDKKLLLLGNIIIIKPLLSLLNHHE